MGLELKVPVSEQDGSKLVNALVDAVSPFTEGMGLWGDEIKHKRAQRTTARFEEGRSKALENNIEVKPVSDKFLIPFIEATSLEDNKNLQEMWVNLLLHQVKSEDDESRYIDILKQLSSKTASYLNQIYDHAIKNGYNPYDSFLEPVQAVTVDGDTVYHSYKADSDDSYIVLQVIDVNMIRADTEMLNRFEDFSVLEQLGLIDLVKYADFVGGATLRAKLTLSGYQFVNICIDNGDLNE